MAASTRFAGIAEMLLFLMERVASRKQLAKLRRVNKAFEMAATPFLFREVYYDVGAVYNAHPKFDCLKESPHLCHVRKLAVKGSWSNWEGCNDVLQQMFPRMAQLESVEISGFLISRAMLGTLQESCPRIKSMSICFPDLDYDLYEVKTLEIGYYDPTPAQPEVHQPPDAVNSLADFTHLEELSLENFHGDLDWWRATIVKMLNNSPCLKRLSLSISTATINSYRYNDQSPYWSFFEDLCYGYAQSGAEPLSLESLHCGRSIFPSDDPDCLKMLTELTQLKQVYIDNGEVFDFVAKPLMMTYSLGDESPVGFEQFGPEYCPHLRRFSVFEYQSDVQSFFATISDESFSRQLAISCESQGMGYELDSLLRPCPDYPALPLHFRMLELDLFRDPEVFDGNNEAGGDDYHTISAADIMEHLTGNDNGALEGLVVLLPWEEDSNGRCQLQRLELVEQALPRLQRLTQLAVTVAKCHQKTHKELEDMVTSAAEQLAAAGPTLHYIKVHWKRWQIWRNRDGTVRLDELDEDEARHVELFSHSIWAPDY
ncbi:hypothetical protein V8F06_013406 [Rhypophila decipiens]